MDISRPTEGLFTAKDLVVAITGGGSGIGLAFTAALARNGAKAVYILGRRVSALEEAARTTDPAVVKPVQCNIADPASIAAAVTQIESETDHVDVLINNAGIEGPDHKTIKQAQSIQELQGMMLSQWDLWDSTWQTNTASVVSVSASFLHLLDKGNQKRGWISGKRETQQRVENYAGDLDDRRTSQIVTVTSISGFNREITAGLAYTASKAGATLLGKSLSNLLAPWGIRSNVIAPGRYPSDMTASGPTTFPVNQIPHGRPGEYDDLAALILYLVGKGGAYVNGNVSVADGGRLSVMPGTY